MRETLYLLLAWIVLAQGAPILDIDAFGDCQLSLVDTQISDQGDGDGFADTNETLQIGISLVPICQLESVDEGLRDCVAWLSTESPAIDCMRRSEILIGDIPGSGPAVTPEERFEIKIGSVDRHDQGLGPNDPLDALLILDLRCVDGSEMLLLSKSIELPLDLNVSDLGQTPVEWKEDFEAGGTNPADPLQGTAFYAENLDAGLPGNSNAEGLLNGDGWRCQYADPDWHNSSSYNGSSSEWCFPGVNLAHANAIFWQVDGSLVAGTPDGGRAYRGEKSMYFGVFLGMFDEGFTTPHAIVESVATHDLINLGVGSPQLSFWHQISLFDDRDPNVKYRRSYDRGVVQIQLHDSAGAPTSPWTNLVSIQNSYGQQAGDRSWNCQFDPIDDGNTEDDFFDPTDPARRDGPSSTCFPSFTWSSMGSTTGAFSTDNVRYATTPPASSDAPSLGVGTWVQSRIDLSQFQGRRAKLRYLISSMKFFYENYYESLGGVTDEVDDGWWIDDMVIDTALTEPAEFSSDRFLLGSCTGTGEACIGQCRSSLAPCSDAVPCSEGEGACVMPCPSGEVCAGPPPDCGANCTEALTNVFVEPDGPLNPGSVNTAEPGEPVIVNFAAPFDAVTGAEPSWLDSCIDGHRQYRVCISGDPDGDLSGSPDADCDDAWDRPICESCSIVWSLESMMSPAPDVVTTYAIEVRCSSVPDCRDGRTLEIIVECSTGSPNTLGLREMRALDEETLAWRGPLDVDWLRGSFSAGADIGDYVADFTDVASFATSIPMDGDPPAGTGYYYLVKMDGPPVLLPLYLCDSRTWRSGGDAEISEPARNLAFGNP